MKSLRILNHKGDEVLEWVDEDTSVQERFVKLQREGYAFHRYDLNSGSDDVVLQANSIVNKFADIKEGDQVIAVPRFAGG